MTKEVTGESKDKNLENHIVEANTVKVRLLTQQLKDLDETNRILSSIDNQIKQLLNYQAVLVLPIGIAAIAFVIDLLIG